MSSSPENLTVNIGGDAGGAVDALSALLQAVRNNNTHFAQLSETLTNVARASQGTQAAAAQIATTLSDQAKAATEATAKQDDAAEKVKKVGGAFKDLGESAVKMGAAISQGTNPLMAITDQLPSIVGSLSGFGPAGIAVGAGLTAVAASGYALISHLIEVDEKVQSIAGHMRLMGHGTQTLEADIHAWADELVKDFGVTETAALNMIGAVTSGAPRMSTELQHTASEYATMLTQFDNVKDAKAQAAATDTLARAMAGDFAAIHALSEQLNFLSAAQDKNGKSQKDLIDNYEKVGDRTHASELVRKALAELFRKSREEMAAAAKAHTDAEKWRTDSFGSKGFLNDSVRKVEGEETQHRQNAATMLSRDESPDDKRRDNDQVLLKRTEQALQQRQQTWEKSDAELLKLTADTWQKAADQMVQGSNAWEDAILKRDTALAQSHRQENVRNQADLQTQRAGAAQATLVAKAEADARLQIKISAIRQEEAADKEDLQFQLMKEREILAAIQAAGREGTAEYQAQAERVRDLKKRRDDEELDREITNQRAELQANVENADERLRISLRLSARELLRYGDDTAALEKAKQADLAIIRKYEDAVLGEERKAGVRRQSARTAEQQENEKDADQRHQFLNLSATETAKAKIAEVEAARQATVKAIEFDKQSQISKAITADQIEAITEDMNGKIVKANDDAETKTKAILREQLRNQRKEWQETISGITKSMGSMVQGLVTGTKTARESAAEMAKSVLSQVTELAEKRATTWIMKNLGIQQSDEDTATKGMEQSVETATAQIKNAAATGAANVYASASAGPEWWVAPAISAAVQLAIAGLTSSLSSAAGGWGRVPADGMLTELHKDEMVLPASIATPMRSMLAAQKLPTLAVPAYVAANLNLPGGGAANANGPLSAAGGGSVTLNVQAMDSRDVASFFNRHGDKLVSALRGQKRNFAF